MILVYHMYYILYTLYNIFYTIYYIRYIISLRYIQYACNIETCKFEILSIKHRDTGSDHVTDQTPRHQLRSYCLAQFGTSSLLVITQRRSNHPWKPFRFLQLMYLPPVNYKSYEIDEVEEREADGEEKE